MTVGVLGAEADRGHVLDLEGLAQRRLDARTVAGIDDVETGASAPTPLGVAVDLLALGTRLDDVEVAVDDDDRVGRRREHRFRDRRALVQLALNLLAVRDVLARGADPPVLAQRAPRDGAVGPVAATLTIDESASRFVRSPDHDAKLVFGRLHVVRVDEVRERHAAQFIEVPAQHVVPRRIYLDQLAVLAEDREQVGGTVEEVADVRYRRPVVPHLPQTPWPIPLE